MRVLDNSEFFTELNKMYVDHNEKGKCVRLTMKKSTLGNIARKKRVVAGEDNKSFLLVRANPSLKKSKKISVFVEQNSIPEFHRRLMGVLRSQLSGKQPGKDSLTEAPQ